MAAPYRSDHDALMTRLTGLLDELSSIRARASALRDLDRSEKDVEREIAEVRREVARVAPSRLPLLDRVSIASPCSADWDSMTGDDRARFCGSCQKHVYNIAGMTSEEAEALLRERGGDACVRIYRRADGTVLTADCAVGVRRRRRRRAIASLIGGGICAAGAAISYARSRPPDLVMGGATFAPTPTETVSPPVVGATASSAVGPTPPVHAMGGAPMMSPEMQLDGALAHVRALLDQRARTTDPEKRRSLEAEIRAASQRVVLLSSPPAPPKPRPRAR